MINEARFNLRSWTSNSEKVRILAEHENVLDKDEFTKVLGMRWDHKKDELLYPEKEETISILVTKREILRYSSKIYDPLGFLSPVTIRAKILLQELWKLGSDWDTPLEGNIYTDWIYLKKDIKEATQTTFPRYYFTGTCKNYSDGLELHVFVDASVKAYGAVAYVCKGKDSSIVMAKTRVAPLKELTLPQLELMAAVVGARLAQHIRSTLDCKTITMWSDSQIVLHWLKSSKTLKRFISNRVKEIQTITRSSIWRYCPTSDNPADLLTRGITIEQYKSSIMWRNGPHWLTDMSIYPNALSVETTLSTFETDKTKTSQTNLNPCRN